MASSKNWVSFCECPSKLNLLFWCLCYGPWFLVESWKGLRFQASAMAFFSSNPAIGPGIGPARCRAGALEAGRRGFGQLTQRLLLSKKFLWAPGSFKESQGDIGPCKGHIGPYISRTKVLTHLTLLATKASRGVAEYQNRQIMWPGQRSSFTRHFKIVLLYLFRSNSPRRASRLLGARSLQGQGGWASMKPQVGRTFVLPTCWGCGPGISCRPLVWTHAFLKGL